MTRATAWLVNMLAGTLEPAEREAVLGDLAEADEPSNRVLRDVAGLVARRQLALWKHWQPWLLLIAVVIPLGFMLGLAARSAATMSMVRIWRYVGAASYLLSDLGDALFLKNFAASVASAVMLWLSAICKAWGVGFGVGVLAGRTRIVSLFMWTLFVLWGTTMFSGPGFGPHPSFAFVTTALTITYLTLLPALHGVRHAVRRIPLSTRSQRLLLIYFLILLPWITIVPLSARYLGTRQLAALAIQANVVFSLISFWPIVYWIVRRRRASRGAKSEAYS